jgi:uncharacterized protein YaaN involved in tellurite resistance
MERNTVGYWQEVITTIQEAIRITQEAKNLREETLVAQELLASASTMSQRDRARRKRASK